VHERNALGFHIPGKFDKVLDIEKCYLQDDLSNQIRLAVKEFACKQGFTFYNQRQNTGFMRNLIIRNTNFGEWMVIVVFGEDETLKINSLMDFLKDAFPQITSLFYVVNKKVNDTLGDQEMLLFSGKDYILEDMDGLRFKIGPKSFFQTNSTQALNLYKQVLRLSGLTGKETVYDLYTGTGTIANFIARHAKTVLGIEYVEDAIVDARVNAASNNIENTLFFAGDMKDILTPEFIQQHGSPDVIITDPPRAGMHPDVLKVILYANPASIIYVSCNPATQARDLEILSETYKVTDVVPFDMFPHTHHVENIVRLERI
jgi:23S rRNA (uracil1939-C5)-methyltransferase